MTPAELLFRTGKHFYCYGPYASTAARRLKAASQQFHPRMRFAILQPGSPPAPGNMCVLHTSDFGPQTLKSRSFDGLIFAGNPDNLVFIDAHGQRHEVELFAHLRLQSNDDGRHFFVFQNLAGIHNRDRDWLHRFRLPSAETP